MNLYSIYLLCYTIFILENENIKSMFRWKYIYDHLIYIFNTIYDVSEIENSVWLCKKNLCLNINIIY